MLEWFKRHAWKACSRLKRLTSSNLVLSAKYADYQQVMNFTHRITHRCVIFYSVFGRRFRLYSSGFSKHIYFDFYCICYTSTQNAGQLEASTLQEALPGPVPLRLQEAAACPDPLRLQRL